MATESNWKQFNPETFNASEYGLPTLDAEIIESAYESYVSLLADLKEADESETKSDGTKKPNRLETYANTWTLNSDVVSNLIAEMFHLAQDDPSGFACSLYQLREAMKSEVKAMADVVLPDVLSTVSVSEETETDEETEAIRNEAYGLRMALSKQIAAAKTLDIDLTIKTKSRKSKTGTETQVTDLPQVPGTRSAKDEETSFGRQSIDSTMRYEVNGNILPHGTSLDKAAFIASDSSHIFTKFDVDRELAKSEQVRSKNFAIELPNGSSLIGTVIKKK